MRTAASVIAALTITASIAAPASAQSPDFGAGSCGGYFHRIQVVAGQLEWGAESHCTGTGWAPHRLTVRLQREHDGIFFSTITERDSAGFSQGAPDISLHFHQDECENSHSTTYRMTATVTAGTHTQDALDRREYYVPCSSE
jgi:hypothetical protein